MRRPGHPGLSYFWGLKIDDFQRDQRVERDPQDHRDAERDQHFGADAWRERRAGIGIDGAEAHGKQTKQRKKKEASERADKNRAMHRAEDHACSSSTSVPTKSFGCRKITGLPCAPMRG